MPYRDAALASLSRTDAVAPPVPLLTDNQLFAFADAALSDPFALTPYTPQSAPSPTGLNADPTNTQSGNGGGVTSLVPASASSLSSPPPPSGTTSPPPVVPPPTMPPMANPDSYPVGQGTFTVAASAGVLSNDTNPTGQPMSAVLVTTTTHGVLSLGANGSLTYTATAGYSGLDSFTYNVTAGGLTSNTATDNFYVSNTSMPPTVTNPGNQTSAEGQAVNLAVQASGTGLQYAAVNLPTGLGINASTGVISGMVDYAAAENFGGTYATTVIVAGSSGSATQQFTWTITNTARPPVLANPGMQTSSTGVPVSLQLAGSSPDGDTLAYTAVGLPSGLSIDATVGSIAGVIAHSANLSNSVTVTATDTITNAATSQTFAWSVMPMSHAPTLDPIAAQINAAGDAVLLSLNANDVDGNPLTFTATGLPTGLGINATTGDITGTIANSAYRTIPYAVTVTASDGTLSASQSFAWSVTAIHVTNPGDQSGTIGQAVSLPIAALDLSGGTLSYSATNLPVGLAINPTTGSISGSLAAGTTGQNSYQVMVTATDGSSSATQHFNWVVSITSQPPVLANPGNQTSNTGAFVSLQLAGSSPVGNTLSYTAVGLPSGLAIDPVRGIISGSIDHSATLSNSVTVTATDPASNATVSQVFTWSVTPTSHAPTLDPVVNQINAAGDLVDLLLNANDVDGNPLTITAFGLPSGLSINPATGETTGTITNAAYRTTPYLVTVSATDGTLSASQSFAWTVGAIQFVNPGYQSGAIGDIVSLPILAQDLSGRTLSYGATCLPSGLSINPTTGRITGTILAATTWQGSYQVTVTATDGIGTNSLTFGWALTAATGTTAPTITDPGTQSRTAGGSVSLPILASSAAGSLTYSVDELPDGLTINAATGIISGTLTTSAIGTTNTTLTVIDRLGGTASDTFTWVIAPAPLTLSMNALTAAKGIAIGPVTIGTFTTTDLSAVASDYLATIAWGDGNSSAGTINGGNGTFTVSASHAYASAGTFVLGLTVAQADGSSPTSATRPLSVVDLGGAGPVSLQGFDIVVETNGEVKGGQVIATFQDNSSQSGAGVYTATLYGSDGSVSNGVVTGGSGSYTVATTDRYTTAGSHTVRVVLAYTLGQLSINVGGLVVKAQQKQAPNYQAIAMSGVPKTVTKDVSGPVVTDWYARDVVDMLETRTQAIAQARKDADLMIKSSQASGGMLIDPFSAPSGTDQLAFKNQVAYQLAPKWMDFGSPTTGQGVNTVVLADRVLRKNILGNIEFGIISDLLPPAGFPKHPVAYFYGGAFGAGSGYPAAGSNYTQPFFSKNFGGFKGSARADNLAAFGVGHGLAVEIKKLPVWAKFVTAARTGKAVVLTAAERTQFTADVKNIIVKLLADNAAMARRVNKYQALLKAKLGANAIAKIPVDALFFIPEYGGFNTESLNPSKTPYKGPLTSREYFQKTLQPEYQQYKAKYANRAYLIDDWLQKYREDYAAYSQLTW